MANDNAVINYWLGGGGGRYYFKCEGATILAPLWLTAQKSCPLQKCGPPKIVTVQCNNILSIRMLHRENPYERNFETIVSLD